MDALLMQAQGTAQADQASYSIPPPHTTILVCSRLAGERVTVLKLLHSSSFYLVPLNLADDPPCILALSWPLLTSE